MNYMLIDTSTSNLCIAVIKENKILSEYFENIKSDMSSKILKIIDGCLKKSNINISNIDFIFVVNGPGSFTGIRVGVTLAKVLAWSLNKKIITISSLELMATSFTSKKYVVPIIDAKRNNVFAGIYDKDLNCIFNDQLININDLLKRINDDYEIISYDNFSFKTNIPKIDILKILNKHKNDLSINPHNVNPNYLKLTEAEEKNNKND